MKYTTEKKKTIVLYILDKIASGTKGLSNVVADAFGISTNTVHTYINELIDEGIIAKRKRGEYELATQRNKYSFLRSQGELEIDTQAFDLCLSKRISHLSENVQHIWAYAMSEMVNNVIDHSNAEQMFVIKIRGTRTRRGLPQKPPPAYRSTHRDMACLLPQMGFEPLSLRDMRVGGRRIGDVSPRALVLFLMPEYRGRHCTSARYPRLSLFFSDNLP